MDEDGELRLRDGLINQFYKCINEFFNTHPQQAKWGKLTKYGKIDQAKDIRNAARCMSPTRGTPKK